MSHFKVLCEVSGGVTGTRQAFQKRHGVEQVFATRQEAEAAVAARYEGLSPYRTADYRFSVVEVPEAPEILALQTRITDLEHLLDEVLEEIEGYMDVKDGEYGPVPNWAMSLTNRIEFALGRRPGP